MSTTILSFQNRVVIETLHNEGRSLRYIANYLGFSKTTIFGTIPCQVDTYKNENTIFLIRPNRGNIPPRFGHFF